MRAETPRARTPGDDVTRGGARRRIPVRVEAERRGRSPRQPRMPELRVVRGNEADVSLNSHRIEESTSGSIMLLAEHSTAFLNNL